MNAARFHNALRIMLNIEIGDLSDAGVTDENWGTPKASHRAQLSNFIRDPFNEALRMPDANFEKLFALIESKQPKPDADADMFLARATQEALIRGVSATASNAASDCESRGSMDMETGEVPCIMGEECRCEVEQEFAARIIKNMRTLDIAKVAAIAKAGAAS